MLSLVPEGLLPMLHTDATADSGVLQPAVDWFMRYFKLSALVIPAVQPHPKSVTMQLGDVLGKAAPRSCSVQLVTEKLLTAIETREGSEEELATLFVALLRSHGARTRSVRLVDTV